MLTGPLSPSALPPQLLKSLLTGTAPFLTTLRGTPEAPLLLLGGKPVPLAPGSGLLPGDTVRVHLRMQDGVPRVEVARQDAPAPPASPGPANALTALLARLSEAAGRPLPAALLPPGLPPGDAVRQLVALFSTGPALGTDLTRLAAALKAALPPGHPLLMQISSIMEHIVPLLNTDPAQIVQKLRALHQRRAPESKIAGLSPDALASFALDDLASLIDAAQGDEALLAALRQSGELENFLTAAGGVLERLDGARAQQLHGQAQAYAFLELPLPPESGFRHGALHLFHEGHPEAAAPGTVPAVAVLDVDLSGLGPLWIRLRALGGACQCEIRAVAPEAQRLLDSERDGLAAALHQSGFAEAAVSIGAWDGDRLAETAALLARLRPLDLTA